MIDDTKRNQKAQSSDESSENEPVERRAFLKKAGVAAVAAPAATLLLSAKAMEAQAIEISGIYTQPG